MKIVNTYHLTLSKSELIHLRELTRNITSDELRSMGLDVNLNSTMCAVLFEAHGDD